MMTNKPIQQQHQPLKKYNTTSGLIEVTSSLLGDEDSSNRPSNNNNSSNKPVVVVVEKKKKTSLTAQQDVSPPPPPITRISDSSSTTTSSSSISKQFTPPPPPNYLEESTVAQKEAVAVPKELKSRLYHIFAEIEKEFDALYQENALLREQLFLFNCNNTNNNNNMNNSDSNQYNNSRYTDENGQTVTATTTNINSSNPYSSTSTLVATANTTATQQQQQQNQQSSSSSSTSTSSLSNVKSSSNPSKNVNFPASLSYPTTAAQTTANSKDSPAPEKCLSPKSLTAVFNNESGSNSAANNNHHHVSNAKKMSQLTSSLTSSAVTALASTSQSAKSALLSSKTRINNLSFPKFKPNAREFILQSIKSAQLAAANNNNYHVTYQQPAIYTNGSVNPNSSILQNQQQNQQQQHIYNPRLETSMLEAHKDGIWDVNCISVPSHLFTAAAQSSASLNLNRNVSLLVGTASADTTARLWYFNQHQMISANGLNGAGAAHCSGGLRSSAFCVQEYCGHTGSVNSVRFHPKFFTNATNLILTASGDCQAHIWQSVLSPFNDSLESKSDLVLNYNNCFSIALSNSAGHNGNGGQINGGTTAADYSELISTPSVIRSPIRRYEGHSDACIAAEWFPDGELLATASWDRTANVYNVETGKILCNLQHDDYLTNVTAHMSQKIILTASKDTTFKIWDFRDPICSVQIYQGHTRSVNSAIFVDEDKIATSSDDQHLKLWDLRVMRSPVFSVNLNAGVNRICSIKSPLHSSTEASSSLSTYICAPLDNRDIKVYNLLGERVLRLPRNSRSLLGHRRLVTSVASHSNMLFSASFDKSVQCWSFDFSSSPTSSQIASSSSSSQQTFSASSEQPRSAKNSITSRFLLNKENSSGGSSSNGNSDLLNELFTNVLATGDLSQQPPLSHITNNNANKSINSNNPLSKLTDKIKI